MRNVAGVLAGFVLLAVACGPAGDGDTLQDTLPAPQPDPEQVPEEVSLHRPAPMLQVTFEASEEGYRLVSARRVMGAPTSAIVTGRAVQVSALDADGEELTTVTSENPRQIRTTGDEEPDAAVRATATLTVNFPRPDRVRAVSVEVRRGPNADFARTFEIPRQDTTLR